MNPTSISAHVLDKLNIPDFDADNELHIRIAKICKKGHETKNTNALIDDLNEAVAAIYQ